MLFDDLIRAEADGLHITASLFVWFDFKTKSIRLWEGDGPLEIFGQTWLGWNNSPLVDIQGLEIRPDGQAGRVTFTLSGVSAEVIHAAVKDQSLDEIEGRLVTVYLAFLTDELTELSGLLSLGKWIMQKPEFELGAKVHTISIPGETVFSQRNKAPNGLATDRDQQRRYPGDKGFEQMYLLKDRTVEWPSH